MSARRSRGPEQPELWQPHELPRTHAPCRTCGSFVRIDEPTCNWCAGVYHLRAEARFFANRWLVAQFPSKACNMPRASFAPFPWDDYDALQADLSTIHVPARHATGD